MGKKEKFKKGKGAEKTSKKTQQKLEKKVLKLEKESGEQSIEEMLDEFKREQEKLSEVKVTNSGPPSPRSHFTFTACTDSNELILFGGEYFDGKKITMYSDVFIYNTKTNSWQLVQSPTSPPPRSGHQAIYVKTQQTPASLWIFGGEYASPTQVRFHHYKDWWCFRIRTRKWEQIKPTSNISPCARSGHRLLLMKNSIFLFGGFSDTGRKTIYFNDLWQFDLTTLQWLQIKLTGDIPSPRSACLFFPRSDSKSLFLFNGYHKAIVTRDVERGVVCSDYFRLTVEKTGSPSTCTSIRCSGPRPKPARSTMAGVLQSSNRALLFGGVHDVESEDGETVVGYFHNDMYTLDLDKAKWYLFAYSTCKKSADSDKMEPPKSLPKSSTSSENSKLSDGVFSLTLHQSANPTPNTPPMVLNETCLVPSPRSNPGFTMLGSTLYLYGGVFEVGDRKVTLDDFYSLDLNQPTSWQCLYVGTQEEQEWHGSDLDEDSESEDGEGCQDAKRKVGEAMSMDVDSDDSDSEEEESDEDLEEDAPIPDLNETYTTYWNRTSDFWFNLVTKGLDSEQSATASCDGDPATKSLAERLAKDVYNKHCKKLFVS